MPTDSPATEPPHPEPPRIIVIDDDQRMLHAMLRLLRSWYYQVDIFSKARDAVSRIQIIRPDLVIFDVYMPELDGFELMRILRQHQPQLPLIAMSGDSIRGQETHVLAMCRQLGAADVLHKPICPEELQELISRYLPKPDGD
jgi:CheY-like chemotaxis protein